MSGAERAEAVIEARDNPQPRPRPGPQDGRPALPCPICSGLARCDRPALKFQHSTCTKCGFLFTEPAREHNQFRIEEWREAEGCVGKEWWPMSLDELRQLARAANIDHSGWTNSARVAEWLKPTGQALERATAGRTFRVARADASRAVYLFES